MTETTPSRSRLCGRAAPHPLVALFLAGSALVAGPSLAGAQTTPVIEEGSRVRVTAPSLGLSQMVGRVEQAGGDTLVIRFRRPRPELRIIERSAITEMDVSVGRDRHPLEGFGIGLLVGALSGAVIGAAEGDSGGWSTGDSALMGAGALGVLGAVGGLLVGMAAASDTWQPVDATGAEVMVLPAVGAEGAGLRVGVSIPIP